VSDPVVTIDADSLHSEPGGTAECGLRLQNVGNQVERYRLRILGPARAWGELLPDDVALMPGSAQDARLVFRPPVGAAAPVGTFPFGVRVVSQVDGDRCAVVEGDISVTPIQSVETALATVTGTGRHRGRYRLDVRNSGTAPAAITITANDPKESLSFALHPERLDIAPGGTGSAFLLVRPVQPKLLGKDSKRPFWLGVTADGFPDSPQVDGEFLLRAVLPRAVATIAITVALVAVAVVAFRVIAGR
jgi:uncharacterized membrane protein